MSEGEIEEENERRYREGREGGVSQHYKLPRASLTHALWNLSSGRGGGHHFIITPPPPNLNCHHKMNWMLCYDLDQKVD